MLRVASSIPARLKYSYGLQRDIPGLSVCVCGLLCIRDTRLLLPVWQRFIWKINLKKYFHILKCVNPSNTRSDHPSTGPCNTNKLGYSAKVITSYRRDGRWGNRTVPYICMADPIPVNITIQIIFASNCKPLLYHGNGRLYTLYVYNELYT